MCTFVAWAEKLPGYELHQFDNTLFLGDYIDFNDNEIAMVKTMQEAIEIFKEKYPYMDNNLIKNFIYKLWLQTNL
mgnify:CR=1 FL=1